MLTETKQFLKKKERTKEKEEIATVPDVYGIKKGKALVPLLTYPSPDATSDSWLYPSLTFLCGFIQIR